MSLPVAATVAATLFLALFAAGEAHAQAGDTAAVANSQAAPLGASPAADASALRQRLTGKVLHLRLASPEKSMDFDASGAPVKAYKRGTLMRDAALRVRKVEVKKDGTLVIRGQRLLEFFGKEVEVIWIEAPGSVEVRIAGTPTPDAALNQVFLPAGTVDEIATLLRKLGSDSAERRKLNCATQKEPIPSECKRPPLSYAAALTTLGPVAFASEETTPPRAIHTPNPEYAKEAHKQGRQGRVPFLTIIGREGEIEVMQLLQPLGMGLDRSAADALMKWRFEPAKANGKPVACILRVEIMFRLN